MVTSMPGLAPSLREDQDRLERVLEASGAADVDLLGTAKRRDGSTQVTYGGQPLYYYAHEGPGEVKCHNVATHGGLWWVAQPDGDRAP